MLTIVQYRDILINNLRRLSFNLSSDFLTFLTDKCAYATLKTNQKFQN